MLKIGIVGCGKIAQVRHAPEYSENPDCQITGFYDFVPENAQKLAAEYGAKAYDSLEALLSSGVDAVSICSANVAHASAAIAALERGIHVLCEKPMAVTPEDVEAMIQAQEKSGKFLMIAQNQRFARAHVEARRLISEGAIGRVLAFHTTFGHPGPEGWTGSRNSWFFDKKRAAFGAMADLGVHKTDLMHYLLGEPIVKVTAQIATLDKKYPDGTPITVDDNAFCLYETASGVLRIYDDPQYSLILEKPDGEIERFALDQLTSNKEQTSGGRTNTGVIDAFVGCLTSGRAPEIDGREAAKAMRVIFAAEQSAREQRTVTVSHP